MLLYIVLQIAFALLATAAPTNLTDALPLLPNRANMCSSPPADSLMPADCFAALQQMPMTMPEIVSSAFGNRTPRGSPFRLPRFFAQGSCMIGIAPRDDRSYTTSWNELAARTTRVIDSCVNQARGRRRGGVDYVGLGVDGLGGIIVEVFPFDVRWESMLAWNNHLVSPINATTAANGGVASGPLMSLLRGSS